MSNVPWLIAFALTAWAIHSLLIRPVFSSPLSKIPAAHWSVRISPLWILWTRKRNRENRSLRDAHRKYGPVLQVAPDALSVDGPEAVKTVYQGGFDKDPWYSVFDNYGVPCMFSARTSPDHSARKRMIAHVYSKSFLQSSPALKDQCHAILFDRLLPLLTESASPLLSPNGIDAHALFLATTMDFISAYVYGLQNSTNFIQNKSYRDHWLELYSARNDHHFWPQEMPRLTEFCRKFGIWLYPSWVDDANEELSRWNLDMCQRTKLLVEEKTSRDFAMEPVVFSALNAGINKEANQKGTESILFDTIIQQRDLSVASELFDHVLAGQETAGVTLTYLCWHLCKRPPLQKALREQLLTLAPSMRVRDGLKPLLPNAKDLDALPLLDALIMETLRLHAPIPGAQPRRTPFPSCTIGGYTVPGGTRIAALAHNLHRDERSFPDPEAWDHTRWLPSADVSPETLRERHRQFWAFSSGGRMCIGSNFAMNEMKFILAAIYTNFDTYIVDDHGMDQTDGYTARPSSETLWLRFEPVKPGPLFGIYDRAKVPSLEL